MISRCPQWSSLLKSSPCQQGPCSPNAGKGKWGGEVDANSLWQEENSLVSFGGVTKDRASVIRETGKRIHLLKTYGIFKMQIRKLPWLSSKYYNITISPIPAPSRTVSYLPLPFTSRLHDELALCWGGQGLEKVSNKWPRPSKARQEISLSVEKMLSDSGFGFRKQINCNYTKYLEAASYSRFPTGVTFTARSLRKCEVTRLSFFIQSYSG